MRAGAFFFAIDTACFTLARFTAAVPRTSPSRSPCDRSATLDTTHDPAERGAIRAAIAADRAAAEGLDRLVDAYARATATD